MGKQSERLPWHVEQAARDLCARARARFGARLRRALLFGSHARGEGGAASDVDVFLLVDSLTEKERGELFETAGQVSIDHLISVQSFAPLPDEHRWLERHDCRILRDLTAEGIEL